MTYKQIEKEFIEKGADLEHERWSKWQQYLHSKCTPYTINSLNATTKQYEEIHTGGLVIPRESVIHWTRQIFTDYKDLSEKEKESDKIEVRKYLPLLKQSFIKYLKDECERLEKSKHKIYDNWATTHDRDDERFTKLTKEEKSYNQAISDQITHITNQIRELE